MRGSRGGLLQITGPGTNRFVCWSEESLSWARHEISPWSQSGKPPDRKTISDDLNYLGYEKEQISIEVIELEKKIAELKLKLNLGEKTDYKSQKKREL